MNRRRFLELLGKATVGGAVAYSFPNIIVPKNIITLDEVNKDIILADGTSLDYINSVIKKEIYPRVLRDNFFRHSVLFARMRKGTEELYDLDFSEGHVRILDKETKKEKREEFWIPE